MATFNLQCNSLSQIHSSVYFRLSIHWRNADTNLAEIHEEMSELVDKQVNVQKENLKKTSGVHAKLLQAHEKVCDENERKKQRKKRRAPKIFFVVGRSLQGVCGKLVSWISNDFRSMILHTLKVLFV